MIFASPVAIYSSYKPRGQVCADEFFWLTLKYIAKQQDVYGLRGYALRVRRRSGVQRCSR